MRSISPFSRLTIIALFLLLLFTACIVTLPTQERTGAQVAGTPADIVVLPEPTNTSPALPEPTGTDPYVLTLTAQPTFPPPPNSDLLTRLASNDVDLPLVTPTPRIIDRVVNLAEGLSDEDIYVVIIHREGNGNEKYLLPLHPLEEAIPKEEFFALRNRLIELGNQDLVLDEYALATPPPKVEPPPLYPESTQPDIEEQSSK